MAVLSKLLDEFPVELLHMINGYLEVSHWYNLRYVNQTIKSVVDLRMANDFKVLWIWFSIPALEGLAALIEPGGLACLVERLQVVGIPNLVDQAAGDVAQHYPYDYKEDDQSGLTNITRRRHQFAVRRKTELLTQIFSSLQRHGKSGMLDKLSLHIFQQPHSTNPDSAVKACFTAAAMFHQVAEALHHSRLEVKNFDIFQDKQRFGIPCDLLARTLLSFDLSESFTQTSSLGIALTDSARFCHAGYILDEQEIDVQHVISGEINEMVRCLITLCPRLNGFSLRWWSSSHDSIGRRPYLRSSSFTHAPNLQTLRIAGVASSEAVLLDILSIITKSLTSLDITNFNLANGSYRSIFDHISSPNCRITTLLLDELLAGESSNHFCDGLVRFQIPGLPKYTVCHEALAAIKGPHDLCRIGDGVKTRLQYGFAIGWPQTNSPEYWQWRHYRLVEYGVQGYEQTRVW